MVTISVLLILWISFVYCVELELTISLASFMKGAGKTTLMSTLCGEYSPERGELVLNGAKATGNNVSVDHLFQQCNVSWCPQHDSLFPHLTVEEHLRFYAQVRGLDWNSESTHEHVDAIVQLLGLGPHGKKRSKELSGGYKRRLSLGIAMIGYPSAMLVDECTTGMDPGARHLVWEALQPDRVHEDYELPATLFSTHYMDEASKLGTRIGIMIDGELVTTGTLDRLQERYCNSYFVEIALQPDAPSEDPSSLEDDLVAAFASQGMVNTSVYESFPYHLKLQVLFIVVADPTTTASSTHTNTGGGDKITTITPLRQLANIFQLLETNKHKLHIKFYSVAQMNLEQIFIDLSRQQFLMEDAEEASSSRRVTSHRPFSSSSRRGIF
jgi:ABC-type multidrug transport system ATPase subunit